MTLHARCLSIRGRLEGVEATLEPGQITAICGPNGAGKSTLLQCLSGLLLPQAGMVRLDGGPLSILPARQRARRIGYLPQDGEVAWDVAVRSLVALGRLPHGDDAPETVDAVMDALDIAQFADRPVSQLSGGEKARVLLGRVLAGQPDWILADEPLAALDLAHQLALMGHLRSATEAGCGVVLVLHDLALAMNHADRVIVLERGHVAADGRPENALATQVVERVWKVRMRWLGEPGARALVAG